MHSLIKSLIIEQRDIYLEKKGGKLTRTICSPSFRADEIEVVENAS